MQAIGEAANRVMLFFKSLLLKVIIKEQNFGSVELTHYQDIPVPY